LPTDDPIVRPNGVILVDNVLWSGAVVDDSVQDESTKAIRAFNDMVAADARVDAAMIPLGDGLTLLRKR
jgi:caffeoyl-CoA O-methyltransferase